MYQPLSPCPSCQRHIRATGAAACPFCGADTREVRPRRLPAAARKRMSRTAMMLLGASLTLVGCSSTPKGADPTDTPAPQPGPPDDDGGAVAEYGAPAPEDDGGGDATVPQPGPPDDDDGALKPMYGVPAPRK